MGAGGQRLVVGLATAARTLMTGRASLDRGPPRRDAKCPSIIFLTDLLARFTGLPAGDADPPCPLLGAPADVFCDIEDEHGHPATCRGPGGR
jgi:hypothetical protein